jgi:hypothetical protein
MIALRALQKRVRPAGFAATVGALVLLAGCAGEGIFPTSGLPPAPPGPPPPFPSFVPTSDTDGEQVMSTAEREAMEQQLAKLAKEREAGVKRRIERGK